MNLTLLDALRTSGGAFLVIVCETKEIQRVCYGI